MLAQEDRSAMLSAEAMRLIYSALLEQIVRSNYRVFDRRHRLSTPHKLYLVGRAWAGSATGACDRIIPVTVEAKKDVVVIGGGFSGLAAGVALAARGFRVAVLEAKPALGGRAYSNDAETGDFVDNGQHVFMGCYHETLDFLEQIGTRRQLIFHRNLEIEMLDGPGRRSHLRTVALPGPLHMSPALLGYRHLTLGERMRLIAGGAHMMYLRWRDRDRLRRMSVAELMDLLKQGERARRCFWYPLAIATLNDDPELASAALMAEVLKRAFFSRRNDSAFVYSKVGLSDLYCGAAHDAIEHAGGVVATRSIVEGFDFDAGSAITGVRLRDGSRLSAANYVAALPPPQFLKLLPEAAVANPFFTHRVRSKVRR